MHILKLVDCNGVAYFKIGRSRPSCLVRRLRNHQANFLTVEPRLSLTGAIALYMCAEEWLSKRLEHRTQMIMYRCRPRFLLRSKHIKSAEICYEEALPLLEALLEEAARE